MIKVRPYQSGDIPALAAIWNEVVTDGQAFPQEEPLTLPGGAAFFAAQTYTAVAVDMPGNTVLGLYILHPNNVGRCGHIANSSYAVSRQARGRHIGEQLIRDSIEQAKRRGFQILQFNAVVASNLAARHLYAKLGFTQLGTIPAGFRLPNGTFTDICLYYISLDNRAG